LRRSLFISLALCALRPALAAGEPAPAPAPIEDGEGEVILVPPVETRAGKPEDLVSPEAAHRNGARGIGEAGFVTVVRLGERAGETAGVAEVLAETVGVYVRSLGGLGGFASVSVRGAPPGHTAVVVDGVPLARLGSATADLGRFEADGFERLELHRGAVPVEHGGAGQASALALVSEVGPALDGRPLRVSVGAGSYGARHARARYLGGDDKGGIGSQVALGYAGATGDYRYYDDNGTPLNQADDSTRTRRNNGYDQVDATLRLAMRRGGWTVLAGSRSQWKQQGVPGTGHITSEDTSLTTWTQLADGSASRAGAFGNRRLTARIGAHLLAELQRYRDLDGEIGLLAQDRRYLTAGAGGRAGLEAALERHLVSAGADLGVELFQDTDLLRGAARERGTRWQLGGALSDAIQLGPSAAPDRVVLVPAVRLDLQLSRPVANPTDGVPDEMPPPRRSEVFASPRLAALARLSGALALKGNAGRYFRAPTALELFGDRGFILGNPALRSETGESADLGLVFAPTGAAGGIDRVYLEAVAFASRSRDTIVLVPTATLVTGAQNLGAADVWGGELVASGRAGRAATVTAHYTQLRSRQRDTLPSYQGKELPQRPRHQLYVRLDLAGRAWHRLAVLHGDAALASGNYLDPANLNRVPDRALFGAGIKLELVSGLIVALEGKNLADQRVDQVPLDPPPRPDLTSAPRAVSDFFGHPLPGRAFYVSLQWEH
jgi:iron complex outermembrane receptor protein